MSRSGGPRGLSPEAFEKLLAFLHGDPARAPEEYQRLHQKLVAIFEWRSCSSPEDLADETFNRVGRRLADGLEVRVEEPMRYLRGVANNIAREDYKRAARQRDALDGYRYLQSGRPPSEETDERRGCLHQCLKRLSPNDRKLILSFYRGEKSARIASRRNQAEELGISRTALRIRAHRLRKELEKCVEKCMKR